MSFLSIYNAIRDKWVNEWSYTDSTFDNEVFTPGNIPWVRLSIRDGDAQQISLGVPSLDRHAGVLFISIFVPINKGQEQARWLADKAGDIFIKNNITTDDGELVFGVPYLINSETDDGIDSGWWQVSTLCPFTHDRVT